MDRYVRPKKKVVVGEVLKRGAFLAPDMEAGAAAILAMEAGLNVKAGALARKKMSRLVEIGRKRGLVRIGGLPIPKVLEEGGFLFCGSPGSGKSFYIKMLIDDLRARGDRVICFDNGGELSSVSKLDSDIVLSPFNKLSPGWSLRNEAFVASDWALLAKSVIPEGDASARQWLSYGRVLLGSIGANVGSMCSNHEILRLMTSGSRDELAIAVEGTPASAYCLEENREYLGSIRGVAATYLSGWDLMADGSFSLRSFMTQPGTQWLWVPYSDAELAASRHLIATWADLLVSAGLDQSGDASSRKPTWIIIDEIDALGPLGRFCDAVTKLRKHNIRIVVGVQSRSQLSLLYSPLRADAILNSLANRVFLGAGDKTLAEWASSELGEQEIDETKIQVSRSDGQTSGTRTEIENKRTKRLVIADEIVGLAQGSGFVRLSKSLMVVPIRPYTY